MDDCDAGGFRVPNTCEPDRGIIDTNNTVVVLIDARKDLHQRRLAGAIFAHQRVNLAESEFETDVLEGADGAEGLGNGFRRQHRGLGCSADIIRKEWLRAIIAHDVGSLPAPTSDDLFLSKLILFETFRLCQ